MCCGMVGYKTEAKKQNLEGKTKDGLVIRHAYSLLDIYIL